MRLITLAIHTYDRALVLKNILEREGVNVTLQNVNLEQPTISSGVRIRIQETDLPLALRIVENPEIFATREVLNHDSHHAIIVPVDFSEYSFNAAIAAFRLAQVHQVEIRLFHSYIDSYVAGNVQLTDALTYEIADNAVRRALHATACSQMDAFADRLRQMIKSGTLPAVKFSTTVAEGVPEDAIIEFAQANPPMFVVMGTRGSDRKESEMIGSVTAEVLDRGRFTILTVPEHTDKIEHRQINNILFFTNLDQEDILAFDAMARILKDTSATVTFVDIPPKKRPFDRSTRQRESIVSYCKQHYPQFSYNTQSIALDRILQQIRDIEASIDVDLLVLPNKRQNVFARLFNPGLAHRILVHADIPMLVIPV
jgi:nucleotide-binding universal stress UspA family protein